MANLTEYFKKLGAGKTAVLLAVAAMAIAGAAVLFLMTQGPAYQVLYAHLPPEDSGAVIDKLKEKRIPYSVSGSSISVPAEKVYEVRMELAGEGIPQGGGVGFEIFDNSGFGITDFVQKVNYKRALQGELARTISQIKEVETARVHLAIPEKGVFLDEQKKTRASIILKLRGGKALTQEQVTAIVHLVANSFDNLKPDDVTVVDTSGRMWTKTSDDNGALRLSTAQLEYKRGLEKDMEARVQSMLEKALGMGKVVARVSADLENRQVERTEETFNPDGQVVRSEQRNKEKTVGGAMMAAGVPGVLSNLPDGAKPAAGSTRTPPQSNAQNEVINYEISKVVSHVVEPVGAIKRLTVAVLVDGSYEMVKGDDGKEIKKYSARSDEEIAKFTQMVKSAVGFSGERGDAVTVVATPFESDSLDFAQIEPEAAPMVPPFLIPVIIKYGSAAFVAIFAIIFILRPIIKRLTQEKAALEAIQNTLPGGLQASLGHGAEKRAIEEGRRADDDSIERLKEVVKNNPQQVAMVLKGWIKEKR